MTYTTDLKILGMDLLTDYGPLRDLLSSSKDSELIVSAFPGFMEAVIGGGRELAIKHVRPTLVTYFNFRVQVWAVGYDADPSTMKKCLPAGVKVDSVNQIVSKPKI